MLVDGDDHDDDEPEGADATLSPSPFLRRKRRRGASGVGLGPTGGGGDGDVDGDGGAHVLPPGLNMWRMSPTEVNAAEYATLAILDSRVLSHAKYALMATSAGRPILKKKKFQLLSYLLLHLTANVFEVLLKRAHQAVRDERTRQQLLRQGGDLGHAYSWPRWAGEGYLMSYDGAWAHQGMNSPHGMGDVVCNLTMLPLMVVFMTKVQPAYPLPKFCYHEPKCNTPSAKLEAGYNKLFSSSKDMDRAGLALCVQGLSKMAPDLLHQATMVRDGDVIGLSVNDVEGAADLGMSDGACHTHTDKNLTKFANPNTKGGLGSVKCPCPTEQKGKNHVYNNNKSTQGRWLSEKLNKQFSYLVNEAEGMYMPELTPGHTKDGRFPVDLDTEERREARQRAIDWFILQLDVMIEHVTNRHSRCSHAKEKDGAPWQSTSYFTCPAQVSALQSYVDTIKARAHLLLTPYGRVSINYCEQLHSVITVHFRPKNSDVSPGANFLLEMLGVISQLQLHLGFLGVETYPSLMLARLIKDHLGITYVVGSERKVAAELRRKVKRKEDRRVPARREAEAKRRAQRRTTNRSAAATEGTYVAGGTTEVVARSGKAAEEAVQKQIDSAGAGGEEDGGKQKKGRSSP